MLSTWINLMATSMVPVTVTALPSYGLTFSVNYQGSSEHHLMRKRPITRIPTSAPPGGQAWMDVDRIASVEVTSEESDYPIEFALSLEGKRGWRAAN